MIFSIVIGIAIFGYAGWTIYRFVKKSTKGTCAGCSISQCPSSCKSRKTDQQSGHSK